MKSTRLTRINIFVFLLPLFTTVLLFAQEHGSIWTTNLSWSYSDDCGWDYESNSCWGGCEKFREQSCDWYDEPPFDCTIGETNIINVSEVGCVVPAFGTCHCNSSF